MPELLIELFSEEIPARMQRDGAETLGRLVSEALAPLRPRDAQRFWGPRRIAVSATIDAAMAGSASSERGPRETAPEQALAGFLRKHAAGRDALRLENGFWVLDRQREPVTAHELILQTLPGLLRRFPWPKSMRWGGTSGFTWVRPLRRMLCLLDGAPVPFSLALDNPDDGHGLIAGAFSEGHRHLSPGAFAVTGVQDWREGLRARHVLADAGERAALIRDGIGRLSEAAGYVAVPDDGLVEEVAGLVEWPVPLPGRIDDAYMDLPPEVMQVSMRVNQRYFALRRPDGAAAPAFIFIANSPAPDGGALMVAGNERVLRARFADARHFWDLDRATPLAERVAALDAVTFHAALGSQGARVGRLVRLATSIAPHVGADPALAARSAHLAKADLLTGMVGEFPELQGVMGEYYALHDGEAPEVAAAIREHYQPRGAGDGVPHAPASVAVALADRIDSLAALFAAGEKPGGSGDPYALRRAALGVIRIVRDNGLRVDVFALLRTAAEALPEALRKAPDLDLLPGFIAERLRVQLRNDGARHDVLAAVNANGLDGDLVRVLALTEAVSTLVGTGDGRNLLAAARRSANILRIEERRDGPHDAEPDPLLYAQDEERLLAAALADILPRVATLIDAEQFEAAMTSLAALRRPLDDFFDRVTVNADDAVVRRNRLRLLSALRSGMNRVADFALVEG
nr:glycine--tRNA ligase subunit beta [uncultured Lichenicoccus sp.]